MLLDCHTHRAAPYPEGVINAEPAAFAPAEGQLYSFGIHPWHPPRGNALPSLPSLPPQVVAIGECGLDSLCGVPMYRQLMLFTRQIEWSEALELPLIIHCVRTSGEIAQLRRSQKPRQPWVVHGFRGKPTVARMLLEAGCHLSYGIRFNPESLAITPPERLLAETDESPESIREVIAALSASAGRDLTETIAMNTAKLFLKV